MERPAQPAELAPAYVLSGESGLKLRNGLCDGPDRRKNAAMRRTMCILGAAAVAAAVGVTLSRRSGGMNLRGRVVLIAGGSRGLGLALARKLAEQGSHLVLCARSEEELQRAKQDLIPTGARVLTIPCDVSDPTQVETAIQSALQHHGRIDVLVNNAGVIHVGSIETMTLDDFETAMETMFWGPVYATLAALPHMRRQGEGRIVNITSLAAKVSVPHLIPYSCAKFAAAAFSEGMRAELQGTGIKVVTIAPGLMRTGSYLNALFKGSEPGEAAWFSLGASLPGVSMNANRAASQIVAATRQGRAERILSVPANLLARFHGVFPGLTADILGLVNRALPNGGPTARRGSETPALERGWLRTFTTLGRKAAEEFLQPSTRET